MMIISQSDFRTVRIEKDSLRVLLSYSLYWNGQERLPESIVSRKDYVTAYFLTAKIRDCFTENEFGLFIERNWSIIPEGDLALSFCFDFPDLISAPYLFPCMEAGEYAEKEKITVAGNRTAYPCGLYLYADPCSVLIYADPPVVKSFSGSIGIERVRLEDEALLRVELRFPPWEGFHSIGNFEHTQRVSLITSSRESIHIRGVSTALVNFKESLHRPRVEEDYEDQVKRGIENCLSRFLVSRGGIFGLKTEAKARTLSSWAGTGLGLIITGLFPDSEDMIETALRLADFSLKGQHPSGMFYETFYLEEDSWISSSRARKGSEAGPVLAVEEAARLAELLIRLSIRLKKMGFHGEKYLLAAVRMVDAFFDSEHHLMNTAGQVLPDSLMPVKSGLGGLGLICPLLGLYRLTGKDRYKKALLALKNRYFAKSSEPLPGLSDSYTALLLAKSAALLSEGGFPFKNLKSYLTLLLPWIYLNRDPGGKKVNPINPVGGIIESQKSSCLLFRGWEFSYLILKLSTLITGGAIPEWAGKLTTQLIGFTGQKPMGATCFDPALAGDERDPFGPFDTRQFVREALHLMETLECFPQALGSGGRDSAGDGYPPARAEGPGGDF